MSTVMQSPFILTLTFLYLFFGNVSFGQPNVYHQANYKHKPIVEMTINNTKTWVLLDTGSDITILDIKSKKSWVSAHWQMPGEQSRDWLKQ